MQEEKMKYNPVRKLLTESGQRQVEERIKAAEASTSGEIVVMVVEESSRYRHASVVGALFSSMIVAVAAGHFQGGDGMWHFLAVFVPLFIVFHELLVRLAPLRRLFARKGDMQDAVGKASLAAFYAKGINGTEAATGVLIYISLFEHMVRVVADKGINGKVDPGAWAELVGGIVQGIRRGDAATALCEAVGRCGELLSRHFPIREGDRNELSNQIRY
jgi:putative membrane protein